MFKKVDQNKKLPDVEKDILAFWEEEGVFEKSLAAREGGERYSFYDGPPFATGLPHYGHIVASLIKDVIPRYWTMRGKYVPRTWGWDCHGLPIENIVEKELGSKTKKEIEDMGVAQFNEKCRSKVLEYAGEWEKIIPRLGRWVDMEHAYRTMDRDFMESVWWVFKQLYDKELVYEDYRSMHICPRCETTLSQSEVTEGYAMVKDLSLIAKFQLTKDAEDILNKRSDSTSEAIQQDTVGRTSLLAWTTTPWTLPGNVALAVGTDVGYSIVTVADDDARYICATELVGKVFANKEYTVAASLTGVDLVGLSYEPLFDYYASDENLANRANGWKVYAADFVTTEDGTGIVHIAPAFGSDDMALGKVHELPFVQHVGMDGVMKPEITDFVGLSVKPTDNPQATDIEIIKNLAHRGLLFHKEKYEHSYPLCWRCDAPLINYATSSWFVSVTKVKEQLLENAKGIHWSPEHIKEGRFGKWLEGARDWSISRQRFWASVMPVWRCDNQPTTDDSRPTTSGAQKGKGCGYEMVFGNVASLEKLSGQAIDDLHKHVVDEVTFPCEKCNGTMRRIPDVLDTWFDSGSMPYAQGHYPFADKETFEQNFPAEFIAEGVDQTRAWFYYLHVLAGAIFEKPAFENVIVNGTVLAEDGKKMSKKLQNYPDPMEIVNKYGADPLRLYLAQSPVIAAENFRFNEKDLAELSRGTFRMLWQSYSFFLLYAEVDKWAPITDNRRPTTENVLDRWIVSQLHVLIRDVNVHMERYELMQAARLFTPFIDDVSNWYIRRSRKRFWKSEDDGDKDAAYATLHYVLVELARVMAPFTPFVSEEIYRNLTSCHSEQNECEAKNLTQNPSTPVASQDYIQRESVHLEDYPVADESVIDEELNAQMKAVRDVISEGLQLRAKAGIKVRQPLASLTWKVESNTLQEEFLEIIKEELNVKDVVTDTNTTNFDTNATKGEHTNVSLDTEITPELKVEGQAREVVRHIQQMRKAAGYDVDDRIVVGYDGLTDVFAAHDEMIAAEVLADAVNEGSLPECDLEKEVKVDGETLMLRIVKVS